MMLKEDRKKLNNHGMGLVQGLNLSGMIRRTICGGSRIHALNLQPGRWQHHLHSADTPEISQLTARSGPPEAQEGCTSRALSHAADLNSL